MPSKLKRKSFVVGAIQRFICASSFQGDPKIWFASHSWYVGFAHMKTYPGIGLPGVTWAAAEIGVMTPLPPPFSAGTTLPLAAGLVTFGFCCITLPTGRTGPADCGALAMTALPTGPLATGPFATTGATGLMMGPLATGALATPGGLAATTGALATPGALAATGALGPSTRARLAAGPLALKAPQASCVCAGTASPACSEATMLATSAADLAPALKSVASFAVRRPPFPGPTRTWELNLPAKAPGSRSLSGMPRGANGPVTIWLSKL
mmetsp:Transcript_64471/g.199696  ORF Transcript_64471/g.199696 Transcript_64471/m.199696 type:complete len:267 (+) Transcript_64471:332-1132(+)